MRKAAVLAGVVALALGLAACGGAGSDRGQTPPAGKAPASRPTVVALGESLTAGLGLAAAEAYPARLQARLEADGFDVAVENAGVQVGRDRNRPGAEGPR